MPEGHTIHRYAKLHRRALQGHPVTAWSPQGRFAEGAARLTGSTLRDVEAYGKHLFYRFDPAGTLHVHLGLVGVFHLHNGDAPPPTPGTRLALATEAGASLYLAGATVVELIDDRVEEQITARLGPDPLRDDADPAGFAAALRGRSAGIGQALLDQAAIAGIGNVYRSEVLFLTRIHPDLPGREVTEQQASALWDRVRRLLTAGERSGRIVTVAPADLDESPPAVQDEARRSNSMVYVYRRAGEPCRQCGTRIESWALGGRLVFACPRHQVR